MKQNLCNGCSGILHGAKGANRPFGGIYCAGCSRTMIKAAARGWQK